MEAQTLTFTRTDSCDLLLGADIFAGAATRLARRRSRRRCALITNEVVGRFHLEPLTAALREAGLDVVQLVIPDGEAHKTPQVALDLVARLLDLRLDRGCPVVGLGGGVIGDLAGFVAATCLRGLPFAFFPTSLLAMVDACLGGKVAVNLPAGKNLLGVFRQPQLVAIDVATLRTLPLTQLGYGLVEALKHGLIADAAYFRFLAKGADAIKRRDPAFMQRVVRRSLNIKKTYVVADEREEGIRAHLNLGHTFGHALEHLGHYVRHSHGEAVGLGLLLALEVSRRLGHLREDYRPALTAVLEAFNLPTRVPRAYDVDTLLAAMASDKKNRETSWRLVLPRAIGEVDLVPATAEVLRPALEAALRDLGEAPLA